MTVYYNEFDPNAAAWLRELIKQGLIADGIVDERSIIDVQANDLNGFTQCHWFGGIGGWSRALRLANWSDDKPVWTASLPCQPFSTAGKQQGKSDERHLLPHFLELVKQCRPDTLFGEQVEAAIRHGWLDDLQAAMEAENYAVGHVILGAHSVQSFHQRQRLYWVAHSKRPQYERGLSGLRKESSQNSSGTASEFAECGAINDRMANSNSSRRKVRAEQGYWARNENVKQSDSHNGDGSYKSSKENQRIVFDGLGNTQRNGQPTYSLRPSYFKFTGRLCKFKRSSAYSGLWNTEHNGCFAVPKSTSHVQPSAERRENGQDFSRESAGTSRSSDATSVSGRANGCTEWDNPDWIYCRDSKYRAIEPSIKPLVNGLPKGMVYSRDISAPTNPNETQEARVMRLKGYGNAIVPQVAAEFIDAFMGINCD